MLRAVLILLPLFAFSNLKGLQGLEGAEDRRNTRREAIEESLNEKAPGLYVERGVRDGIYYGNVTAVDLRTLEIIPYDARPLAPIPDPHRLMADLDTAQRISQNLGYTHPPRSDPRRFPGWLVFSVITAATLTGLYALGRVFRPA